MGSKLGDWETAKARREGTKDGDRLQANFIQGGWSLYLREKKGCTTTAEDSCMWVWTAINGVGGFVKKRDKRKKWQAQLMGQSGYWEKEEWQTNKTERNEKVGGVSRGIYF